LACHPVGKPEDLGKKRGRESFSKSSTLKKGFAYIDGSKKRGGGGDGADLLSALVQYKGAEH